MRMVKMLYHDAKVKYNGRLLIGVMVVIEEGVDKFRLIHDGTHTTLISNRIRARVHILDPLIDNLAAELLDLEEKGGKQLGIVWDFASAHRICQVHPEDWGLQACTLADLRNRTPGDEVEVFFNTVGTFGYITAGHWWGRLAAMIVRARH